MESTVVSLQSILREQLGEGSFREADVDWQANLRVLCAAAKSSKILLVLDDLWYVHLHTPLLCSCMYQL
jgi:hypothetical protein